LEIQEIIKILLLIIMGTIGLTVFGIIFGLIFKGIDRKITAHMQGRIGPPIIQPFRDIKKLFTKENIVPDNAIEWVFNLAPLMGLVGTISILLFLPIGGFQPLAGGALVINGEQLIFGDLILILYLLIIPSLALVIGGFASGSPYATIGAQREMAIMIAYEFPLAIIIITIGWKLFNHLALISDEAALNIFSVSTLTTTPIWNIAGPFAFIGFIILLIVLIIVTPAELSKVPFDASEAETEIGGGLLVEYSGRNLAMFYLMDSVKTFVMASLIVALFFPYNISNMFGVDASSIPAYAIDFIFFLLKVIIVVLFSVTLIRVAFARLKIDQIVYTYWVPITLFALVGLILIMWEAWTFKKPPEGLGWQPLLQMLGLV
jgi:formate hydrogenlyase subunit 4